MWEKQGESLDNPQRVRNPLVQGQGGTRIPTVSAAGDSLVDGNYGGRRLEITGPASLLPPTLPT